MERGVRCEYPKTYRRVRGAMAVSVVAIGSIFSGAIVSRQADAAPATAKKSHALEYVGFDDSNAWLPVKVKPGDVMQPSKEADEIMSEDAAAGAKYIRLFLPFYAGKNDIGNIEDAGSDINRTCNSVIAAYKHGMKTIFTFVGRKKDGSLGYFPQYGLAQDLARKVFNQYENEVYGENGCLTKRLLSDGELPATDITLSPWNEPNNDRFITDPKNPKTIDQYVNFITDVEDQSSRNEDKLTGSLQQAAREAGLPEEEVQTIKAKITVFIGELASRGALGFIKGLCSNEEFKYRKPPVVAVHVYPASNNEPSSKTHVGDFIGPGDFNRIGNTFQQYCGWQPVLVGTESGRETDTTGNSNYNGVQPKRLNPIKDEKVQGQLYFTDYNTAACTTNVDGFMIFHKRDNADRQGWQSGISDPNGKPKKSWQQTHDAMIAATQDGGFDC